MNERIQKLLQESYSHFGHGKYRTPELVAEKFAELIVKECISIVKQSVDGKPVLDLKEHFGVE